MTTSAVSPVRRSALQAVHAGLAGRGGDSPAGRWPLSYGDPDAERRDVARGIGLAEPGLTDKWLVRGPGALIACAAAGLGAAAGTVSAAAPGGIHAWAVGDDEVWLIAAAPVPGGPDLPAVDFGPVVAQLRAAGAFVTDVSSGWTVLRLVGPQLPALLEELVSADLSPAAVPDLAIVQVAMAGCRVILARQNLDATPGVSLLVVRDEAEYLWGAFIQLGAAHGLRAVGAAAVLPLPTATGGVR
jgi:aminomethyltransferase